MTIASVQSETENFFASMICASCGENFSCGATVGKCWCFTIDLEAETLSNLAENFDGCLCAECLKTLSEGAEKR